MMSLQFSNAQMCIGRVLQGSLPLKEGGQNRQSYFCAKMNSKVQVISSKVSLFGATFLLCVSRDRVSLLS